MSHVSFVLSFRQIIQPCYIRQPNKIYFHVSNDAYLNAYWSDNDWSPPDAVWSHLSKDLTEATVY